METGVMFLKGLLYFLDFTRSVFDPDTDVHSKA